MQFVVYLGEIESGRASASTILGRARLIRRFVITLFVTIVVVVGGVIEDVFGFVEPSLYPKFSMIYVYFFISCLLLLLK
jgi:hypothetical protein